VAFYVRLARGKKAVLEYGIGNGRIALPMARTGVSVTGIDHSEPMLADLAQQLVSAPPELRRRVKVRRGDMRKVDLGARFPLVISPFNTVLHLYTRQDVERWLARVHRHLSPKGELVFDVSMPMPQDLARRPDVPYPTPSFVHPTQGRVSYHEYFDYDRVRQILFVSMCFERQEREKQQKKRRGSSDDGTFMTPLAHRQFFPREVEALLHYNGFDVTKVSGDFSGGPLAQDSDVMVWHAKKAVRKARRR
jgi:SAM-dependent methyltransferase